MLNQIKTNKFIDIELIFIIAIAALLRIVLLSNLTMSIDEASNAYDAYSIAETLRDQHSKFLPAFLEGIGGDARESLYILF